MQSTSSPDVAMALRRDKTVDISTMGRRSGQWRRIEIWYHYINGRVYLTGIPRPRGWYANILHSSEMVFHLKESIQASLMAQGRPVTDPEERRKILGSPQMAWYHTRSASRAAFIAEAPLVEVVFTEGPEK